MPRNRWPGQAMAPEGPAAGVAEARHVGLPAAAKPVEDPQWYRDAVIYQLHVKSFFDSNDDGVGDFAGLLHKLDYIAELGVDTLWLLPFYPSPRKDDGYDIADYRGVHPDYGTLQDARRFVREAHARGLKVITELVINHTSDQHPWFQRARAARPGSSHHDYYVWSDTDQKYDGTRIIFLDTEKSNWTWDPVAKAYFWHRFYSHQPDLNFDNPRVLSEVLNVMRFWLDIGVDGLRLDAVPYLVEREGTNNENLSETHEVLKLIRGKLDAGFKGRMLLAEANQWPEDTQQYFGQGDECHMAFHFPLMPRMYMAIAQEDRFPITDILRQTPDIPEGCQWAVFLRNHDELTLEMVTDQERDYLWSTYAADRRARINLGIRRRLSPLLERDRRRIELMNGLLLSMPGTPVIYYGDEIGMGDNIFLGDRDGVRTPMQWSPDRNGGFSKADPARLVLPPIQDPLDGFQAVNVEAQARSPNSLLNWMRRMLAVRRRTRAFGRGQMNLLYPANRKVLAYLREHEDDLVLCVFNLSRAAQAVELDLSAHAGKVPFEMLGGTVFPPVGQLPYLLTLPPYGFYWFMLAGERAMPSWHIPSPEPLPDLRTLVMKMGVKELLAPEVRAELERGVLPEYLAKRRWFAAKGERLLGVRITGTAALPGANGAVVMTEVEAKLADRSERYCLPLAGVEDKDDIGPLAAQLAVSRLRQGRRVGYLTDAFADDRMPDAVLAALREVLTLPTDDGELRFLPGPDSAGIALPSPLTIRRLSAEQSNSSMILGDTVVLKIIRRINPGIHPEAEMTRHLTAAGYGNAAPLLGEVVRVSADGTPHTLMLAQGFVRNQGDAWGWTQDWLKRTIDEMALTDSDADSEEPFAGYTSFAATIGRRLGELHATLSRPSGDAAFAPEPATDADRGGWAAGALAQLDPALDVLRRAEGLSDADKEAAEALLARADALRGTVARLAQSAAGALKTRVHGDFHLGQVLVAQGDAVIVDFEGEPARSLEERRAKGSPLRDVAGLLRSFDYAASVAAANESSATATAAPSDRRIALFARWQAEAVDAFLRAYRAAAAEAPDKWVPAKGEEALLDLFLVEKAAYEVRYEAANRPTWIGLPLRGLAGGGADHGLMDEAFDALAAGRHGDPFGVLGRHGDVVRSFQPGARGVTLLARGDGREIARLEQVHPAGVFAGSIPDRRPYVLRIEWPGAVQETEDPYSFGLLLGPMDLHLLAEGRHFEMGRVLGAQPATVDGVPGVRFAVWAPNARRVSVIGDFNNWDGRRHPMRLRREAGVWELFVPRLRVGALYKYELCGPDGSVLPSKADPVARQAEMPPATASRVASAAPFDWSDEAWMANRAARQDAAAPISIYEVHSGSWWHKGDGTSPDWDLLGDRLIPYVRGMGFTHLEFLPVMEHPFGGSWGYQPLGQFAPSARFGTPAGFARFVDRAHAAGVGVILDWVPAHFPTDAHGLYRFDGTALYEHADDREGFHPEWNSAIYNFGRNEVRGFLLASALHWLERFHVDGLRVDAVASMLYRDYSRKVGEWIPNRYGGRENLEAVQFLQELNAVVQERCPGAVVIAEESTAWPGVTRPTGEGGLGFQFKWNMGWMHDTLHYVQNEPVHRRHHHDEMTFGLVYAWSERFVLPLSHDEVVYGKGSLLRKMPGDPWQQFANLRAYLGFMWAHPGKKLLFMGGELAQPTEWNHDAALPWSLLDDPRHRGVQRLVRDLNAAYRDLPALHRLDASHEGFRWVIGGDRDQSVFAWLRLGSEGDAPALVVCNFTPVPRDGYRVGVPSGGAWHEVLNTDAESYGGTNKGNGGSIASQPIASHGYAESLPLTLPPLATLILIPKV